MNTRQLLRIVDQVRRAGGGRVPAKWLALLVVAAAAYLLLQPVIERQWGLRFPTQEEAEPPPLPTLDPAPGPARRPTGDGPVSRDSPLQDLGNGVLASPAGLRYTPGSQHGHRWRHVLAHAKDERQRPGSHGVFEPGDPQTVATLVDDAYQRAKQGRDTITRKERGRSVHTVDMGRPIGYVGGEAGNARGRPAARKLRLVLEGDRVITAYPVQR